MSHINLTKLQQKIINNYQRDFPLSPNPYQEIAERFDTTEEEVIYAISTLNEQKILSRVGAVFDHKKAGASTLAAIAVPSEQLEKVAAIVNQFEQVNHNYEREHDYNLWFVATASDLQALNQVLEQIELLTGLPVLVLPMEASYHIDLGFNIDFKNANNSITEH